MIVSTDLAQKLKMPKGALLEIQQTQKEGTGEPQVLKFALKVSRDP